MANDFKIADIDRNAIYTVSTIDNWDEHAETREMSGADLISFSNAAAHLYDIHAELITKRPAMKKITIMDYKRAARDAMKKAFGFAPALKNIIPMEGGDNGETVTSVAFCIAATGKGYSWQAGGEVERAEAYDI